MITADQVVKSESADQVEVPGRGRVKVQVPGRHNSFRTGQFFDMIANNKTRTLIALGSLICLITKYHHSEVTSSNGIHFSSRSWFSRCIVLYRAKENGFNLCDPPKLINARFLSTICKEYQPYDFS